MKHVLLSTLMIAALGSTAMAQWSQTSGPEGVNFTVVAADDSVVVGALPTGGIGRYSRGIWKESESVPYYRLALAKGTLLAQGSPGYYYSRDYGRTWSPTTTPGVPYVAGGELYAVSNDSLFAWTDSPAGWRLGGKMPARGLWPIMYKGGLMVAAGSTRDSLMRSTDGGRTWAAVPSTLNEHGTSSKLIAAGPDALYMSLYGNEIFRSVDDGATWQPLSDGLATDATITWMTAAGNTMWAGSGAAVYRLQGNRWEPYETPPFSIGGAPVAVSDGLILMTPSGPIKLGNTGNQIIRMGSGIRKLPINALGAIGNVVTASGGDGTYRSTDGGNHWRRVGDFSAGQFGTDGNVMIAINEQARRSTDSGATWELLTQRMNNSKNMRCLLVTPGAIYVGHGTSFMDDHGGNAWIDGGVLRSTDHGATWNDASLGLRVSFNETSPVMSLAMVDNTLLAFTAAGVYMSADAGGSWFESGIGLPNDLVYEDGGLLREMGGKVYLFTPDGMFFTENRGESWERGTIDIPSGFSITSTPTVLDGKMYIQATRITQQMEQTIRTYAFDGAAWEDISASMPEGLAVNTFIKAGDRLYLGTRGSSVWQMAAPLSAPAAEVTADGGASVYPNPASGEAILGFSLAGRSHVVATLVNTRGEELRTLHAGALDAGEHRITVDTDDLPAGAYFIRMIRDGRLSSTGFVKR